MDIKLINVGKVAAGPVRAHYNDAGADVFCPEMVVIKPHETKAIGLGFGLEIPDGHTGLVFPRSGLSKMGLTCELPPIDSGYRGEIHAIVTNNSDRTLMVNAGDRIGQLVILPVVIASYFWELGDARGADAFGSTGR